ncbi:MAG: hypothetical protein K0S79_61 [Nitrospira sp.]|nr:hypothetical protein [Nitrospira sp.]
MNEVAERRIMEAIEHIADSRPSLRDCFAMAALTGLLANFSEMTDTEAAVLAYEQADEMLKERRNA